LNHKAKFLFVGSLCISGNLFDSVVQSQTETNYWDGMNKIHFEWI